VGARREDFLWASRGPRAPGPGKSRRKSRRRRRRKSPAGIVKLEGFWYSDLEPYFPHPLSRDNPVQEDFIKKLEYVSRKSNQVEFVVN